MKHLRILMAVLLTSGALLVQGPLQAASDTDVQAGEQIYTQCTGCHAPGYHRTGPRHCGVLGRRAGSVTGFEFSPAMRSANLIWSRENLDRFLRAPMDMLPGTTMGFVGIKSDQQRRQLIAFLATLTPGNPLCR